MGRYLGVVPGGYGEGDVLLGMPVPVQRKVARRHRDASLADVERLLASEVHEHRFVGLVIMVERYKRADADEREDLCQFFLDHRERANNWDLIDTSVPTLMADRVRGGAGALLTELAGADSIWDRRIAVLATFPLIRDGEPAETLRLAELLLRDEEDLIHKAVGWMLREVGKRDEAALRGFLDRHAAEMPRTMLRYSLEKLPADVRRGYMAAGKPLAGVDGRFPIRVPTADVACRRWIGTHSLADSAAIRFARGHRPAWPAPPPRARQLGIDHLAEPDERDRRRRRERVREAEDAALVAVAVGAVLVAGDDPDRQAGLEALGELRRPEGRPVVVGGRHVQTLAHGAGADRRDDRVRTGDVGADLDRAHVLVQPDIGGADLGRPFGGCACERGQAHRGDREDGNKHAEPGRTSHLHPSPWISVTPTGRASLQPPAKRES